MSKNINSLNGLSGSSYILETDYLKNNSTITEIEKIRRTIR